MSKSWILNISRKVIARFPELKEGLPIYCKCGKLLKSSHMVVTSDFIYIESSSCTCGVYSSSGIGVTRSDRASAKWLNKYDDLKISIIGQ